jgi:hypothetical protein
MQERVAELVQQYSDLWWEGAGKRPSLGPAYTLREQWAHEKLLERFLDLLAVEREDPPQTAAARRETQERLTVAADAMAQTALGLGESQLKVLRAQRLPQIALQFAQMARRFDPTMRGSDIFQAGRNALTMNSLQLLLGLPAEVTPAILGYSLLYPYSDNTLDDPAIPIALKSSFSLRFAQRLCGEAIATENPQEQTIGALVNLIEGQFARARCPHVYESLMAIHRAQHRSLALLHPQALPYEVNVVGISFEKGGASVLADGYLVAGTLNPLQEEFMFGWGVFLQLLDDLQDVREDSRSGLLTVFSQSAGRWPLDALADRTLHLGNKVLALLHDMAVAATVPLQELMARSVNLLFIDAVGCAGRLFSGRYRRDIETHSPFSYAFLQRVRRKLARQRLPLMQLVEALAATEP